MGKPRWTAWAAWGSLAFAAWSASRYFLGVAGEGLWASALLALLALTAAGSGRVALGALGLEDLGEAEKTLIGATLGLGLLSLGTFALAAAGILRQGAVVALLAALWVAGYKEHRAAAASLGQTWGLLTQRPLAAAVVVAGLALSFWTAWVPPHQYDSLVYHLPLAEAAVRTGRLTGLEGFVYTHFPQNGEMLFSLALALESDLLAQLLMWLSTALCAWWLLEAGGREVPLSAALLACILLATHTSAMLLAGTTYVEALVMLWTTAAVLCFLRWEEDGHAGRRGWLVLSAVFTGLALGTKYYAGITAVLLGAALALRWARSKEKAAGWDLALFTGLVTALFAPWLIKNAVTVGNPVFPFFNAYFPSAKAGWTEAISAGYFNALTEYRHIGGYWGDWLSLPLLLLTSDPRFGRGADILGGLGWELVFWFLPLAAWAAWKNRFLIALLLFCGAYLAAWAATGVVLRFLLALLPLLCLLAGSGVHALWGRLAGWSRAALASAVVLLSLSHILLFLFIQGGVFEGFSPLLGLESRSGYLSRRLDYYPCARWAQEHLDRNDRILIVGEQRSYYLRQPSRATTVHGPNAYRAWANEAANPSELAARLRLEGFSALLTVPREAVRLGAASGLFTEKGLKNWSGLGKDLTPLFRGPACALDALRAPAGA